MLHLKVIAMLISAILVLPRFSGYSVKSSWTSPISIKGEAAFSGKPGRPKKENQSELKSLKQENERLKEEVEPTAAYFVREIT